VGDRTFVVLALTDFLDFRLHEYQSYADSQRISKRIS
jgi:hypothetical protein